MREYSSPLTVEIPGSGNLTDDLVLVAREQPDAVAVSRPGPGGWEDMTRAELLDAVRRVAKGLMAAGVRPGDRIALMSRTRLEWTLLDYAIWFAGAVPVPVYETSTPDRLRWVLDDSEACGVVVETAEHLARLEEVRAGLPRLGSVWTLDLGAVEELGRLGAGVSEDELDRRRTTAGPDDPATVLYTSGTTGRPKGCVLTHRNLRFAVAVVVERLDVLVRPGPDGGQPATLLFLPLAHVLARLVQVGCIRAGVRLGYAAGVVTLVDDLATFRPTFLLAVPRVFEKLFTIASQRAASDGRVKVFDRAARTAIAYGRATEAGRVGPVLRARQAVFDRLVHRRLRAGLGGRCRFAVSGGAPLGERLGHFYRGIGVTVLEGYGLTETAGAATLADPDAPRVGSVGRPLGGTTVRVAEDGELLVRGDQVFTGYWRDLEATAAVRGADGWLRTGDVGEIDAEGGVWVVGRKHELLLTAGGKSVSPALLEDQVRAHPLVSHCLVVGDGQPFIAALVTLDTEAVGAWATARGVPPPAAGVPVDDPELVAEVQRAVDEANAEVSPAEAIRRFRIMPGDWTEERGHLTPSLKLRRHAVSRDFRAEIAALFEP